MKLVDKQGHVTRSYSRQKAALKKSFLLMISIASSDDTVTTRSDVKIRVFPNIAVVFE